MDRTDPQRRAAFDRDFQEALHKVAVDYDTGHIDRVLDDWWGAAVLAEHPPTEREEEIKARADRGDFTGLVHIDEHGHSWREDEHGLLWRTDAHGQLWRQPPEGTTDKAPANTTRQQEGD
ncbi:hypothetical protein CEP50_16625 [Actinopolyspora mortivallis]|uniref:Uncharacterized protein n=1 Tax=Actinopolyspora mortivallis TaxID=33906 RepID=A0A2T0GSW5_ACTMO|nr:hypothetical protein CEP50_16765 [Actinopolyspora mortivallis]PRW62227.1 hypothetical protein CEP50_16625 [Actinopolyspora mortivallis]